MFADELERIETQMNMRAIAPHRQAHLLCIGFRMIQGSAIAPPEYGSLDLIDKPYDAISRRLDRRDRRRRKAH